MYNAENNACVQNANIRADCTHHKTKEAERSLWKDSPPTTKNGTSENSGFSVKS